MNIGKYIFSQVIDFVPRYQFDKLVTKYKGDRHSRELNSYNHLLHLLFGQITGCDSLRDICMCLTAHHNILYHLGIRKQALILRYLEPMRTATITYTRNWANISLNKYVHCIQRQNCQRYLLTMYFML